MDDTLYLDEVSLRNFMSYGNNTTVINLQSPGTTYIRGEDLDSGTGTSNGSGKSTILNALVYGLYDTPIDKSIKLDELINDVNKKNMVVSVKFRKRGDSYEVIRYRKCKNGNTVELYKNGNLITLDSIAQTNKYIEEKIIGYTYDLFVRIVVFPAGHNTFFELPTSGAKKPTQGDLIEELFSITALSQKADILKDEVKDADRKIEVMKAKIEQIEKEAGRHATQITNIKAKITEWDDAQEMKVLQTQKELKRINTFDFETEESHHKELITLKQNEQQLVGVMGRVKDWEQTQVLKIQKIKNDLKRIDGIDFDAEQQLHATLVEKQLELKELVRTLQDMLKQEAAKNKTKTSLTHEHTQLGNSKCPYCLQDYAEAKQKQLLIQTQLDECNSVLESLSENITQTSDKVESIENVVKATKAAITVDDLSSLLKIKNDSETLAARLLEYSTETNPHFTNFVEICSQIYPSVTTSEVNIDMGDGLLSVMRERKLELMNVLTTANLDEVAKMKSSKAVLQSRMDVLLSEHNPHYSTLNDLNAVVLDDIDYTTINEMQHLVDHQRFLIKLLTKTDSFVRKALIDKNIPFLNAQLKANLHDLGLPHKVEFTNTMTASITRNGRTLGYANLSTGQKARVNLALSFAFRDVLQKMHSPINFCLLDEVLDVGLCPIGITSAIKMLKRKAKNENMTMFIISHKAESDNTFDRTMHVVYENGFSNIKVG